MERPLLRSLRAAGMDSRQAPVVIQSFETTNPRELNRMTEVRLSQLINCSGAPWDLLSTGDRRTYADLATRPGLRGISRYADVAGLCKDVMIPRDADGRLGKPTGVIDNALGN